MSSADGVELTLEGASFLIAVAVALAAPVFLVTNTSGLTGVYSNPVLLALHYSVVAFFFTLFFAQKVLGLGAYVRRWLSSDSEEAGG